MFNKKVAKPVTVEDKLNGLQGKVAAAVGLITNTIECLEESVVEYQSVQAELDATIETAKNHRAAVCNAIYENNKVISNFKNLLK